MTEQNSEKLKLTREEIAQLELGFTKVSPVLAWTLVLVFLGTLVLVPSVQLLNEYQQTQEVGETTAGLQSAGFLSTMPGSAEVFLKTKGDVIDKISASNADLLKQIHEFENDLEDESWLGRQILSPTQLLLTRWGGVGNEKAYVGREGWLFYRPGLDYLTAPGFLEPTRLARRAAAGNEYAAAPQPDPRPAILDFQKQLAARGIRLVLMPTPVKPMLEAEQFSTHYQNHESLLQNVSYQKFRQDLETQGVLVFDPAPALLSRKRETGQPQYLATDTHWTPGAMSFVAGQLKTFLDQYIDLGQRPATGYWERSCEISNFGDIAVMMQLPEYQTLYSKQAVTIQQVLTPEGRLWKSAPDSDVLLLGDSFTNIYSLGGMNWGESAGLAEQLSYQLQRPVDRIAQNGAGAYATRQTLALDLARGKDRLAGKRVVVWQFAIRELAVGDWKRIPLKQPVSRPSKENNETLPTLPGNEWLAEGRVAETAGVPKPGSVPYRDAVTSIHLTDISSGQGASADREIVIYTWGMRENQLTDAARFQSGQQVKFKLKPWNEVQEQYGRFTRLELDDPDFKLIDLPAYWAEEVPIQ
ncbi:alginate O-acetyltransferase AlgX-related protein [Gimesia panareensis]|uniref:alginate O-acetyltransferase AlgX-related protein n=1 Tax=Gimesia panareensis TaxID=2527978 RepID=UPI00118D457F|nr:hypothetical protein [Gimesia panareensis]QDU47894.1 hypothetical protein Pan110_02040 [Gimesia panareensis]